MSYTILLVDDDPLFREEFSVILDEYSVLEAADGTSALRVLKRKKTVDLVLLDVLLPDRTGLTVLKEIKSISPLLPVIIITGNSSKDTVIEALRGHADDFIEKPIQVEKTLDRISSILQKNEGNDTAEMKIERVKKFLDTHFTDPITLEDAANRVFMSPKYLSRIFKEITNVSFVEYKINLRLEKAKQLLRTTNLTIEDIASSVGYHNIESFLKIFKKTLDMTPTEYRGRKK